MNQISIRNKTMAYREMGDGPPILFGHSYLWDSAMWQPQLESLSSQYRCIAPDLWGHGNSDTSPPGPVTIETLTEDMLAFADGLGLQQFSVAGLSVGGMWAAGLALAHPQRIASLIIMDSYVGPEPEQAQQQYFGMLDTVKQLTGIPPAMQDAIVPLFFSPVTQVEQPDLIESFRQSLSSIPADRVSCIVDMGRAIFSRRSRLDDLAQLKVPSLILVGEHDLSRPPYESEDMARRISGSTMHLIPNAGHISSLEQPEVVSSHMKTFLSEVDWAG